MTGGWQAGLLTGFALLSCFAWRTLPAQAGAAAPADSIRGHVTGISGPLVGAHVRLTSSSGQVLTALTDARGLFAIRHPGRPSGILAVGMLGYVPFRAALDSIDTSRRIEIPLSPVAQQLARVETRGERPRPIHEADRRRVLPGATQHSLTDLPAQVGDVMGDLGTVLRFVPGVTVTSNGGISVNGLGAEDNLTNLQGVAFGGTMLPRDGIRRTARLGSYDPKIGGVSGLVVSLSVPSGTNFRTQSVRTSTESPSSWRAGALARASGGASHQTIVSATASGPIRLGRAFYSMSGQFDRRTNPAMSPLDAANGISTSGLSAGTLRSVIEAARTTGFPLLTAPDANRSLTASGVARIDLTAAAGPLVGVQSPALYIVGSAASRRSESAPVGEFELRSARAILQRDEASVAITFAPYMLGGLAEFRIGSAMQQVRPAREAFYPSARIFLTSATDMQPAGGAIYLAGSGSSEAEWRRQVHGSAGFRWMSWDQSHQVEVYGEGIYERVRAGGRSPPAEFTFASLHDFAQGIASSYARAVAVPATQMSVRRATVTMSDMILVTSTARRTATRSDPEGLRLQVGIRADADSWAPFAPGDRPTTTVAAGALNRIPRSVRLQPMAGFTWDKDRFTAVSGPAVFSDFRTTISGGVRVSRSRVPAEYGNSLARRSLHSELDPPLMCWGDATPTPDWPSYQTGSASPGTCEGEPGVLSSRRVSDVMLVPDFREGKTSRAELRLRRLLSKRIHGIAGIVGVVNNDQRSASDVNFRGITRAVLRAEGDRPVFVDIGVVTPTGEIPLETSRLDTRFEHVTAVGSASASTLLQGTMAAEVRFGATGFDSPAEPTRRVFNGWVRLAYTATRHRMRYNGFSGTTGGDPRTSEWSPGPNPTHSLALIANASHVTWGSMTAAFHGASGSRYTPIVDRDINGDGYANDRAYIWAAESPQDGISRGAAACLRRQQGRIAQPMSCVGPWSVMRSTLVVTPDPFRLGLGERGSASLVLHNIVPALDRVLHGQERLRGWGAPVAPDPVLLEQRGFDGVAQRFTYATNPRFGRSRSSAAIHEFAPRLTLDVSLLIGRNRESQLIALFVRDALRQSDEPVSAVRRRLLTSSGPAPEVVMLLRRGDSLQITPQQRQELEALRDGHAQFRDSLFTGLAGFLIGKQNDLRSRAVRTAWHQALSEDLRARYATARAARQVLTNDQFSWLRARSLSAAFEFSDEWLARTLRTTLMP